MVKLGKYSRSVSIIGVGCTPFIFALDNPETAGLTEGEFFGYAALEAMQDAGIKSTDVDFYFHGQASPHMGSDYITPNMQVADWFGMRGKGSIHHSEACCTGYLALEQAVNAVASGKYNIVLSGCVDLADSIYILGKSAHMRRKFTMEEFFASLPMIFDRAYTRPLEAGMAIGSDDAAVLYVKETGISDEQMDDVLIKMSINNRHNAVYHPLAVKRKEYSDEAKENGFDNAVSYLKSAFNPKTAEYMRMSGLETKCDGAAAVIVCPTEMAGQFKHKPIEVLGIGSSALEGSQVHLETRGTIEAVRQVYELTGIKPEEIDLFYSNDFMVTSHLISAEIAGYLPKGEGYKYILDGRTCFDGDKPINTNGGRTSFGHAHAASGLADLHEAVYQMRGLCGERQVKKFPKTAMLRGFGGGQNLTATILRMVD
jgi:acetyl-CoA C-acetyltransferase